VLEELLCARKMEEALEYAGDDGMLRGLVMARLDSLHDPAADSSAAEAAPVAVRRRARGRYAN
jgi:hypothetical protein